MVCLAAPLVKERTMQSVRCADCGFVAFVKLRGKDVAPPGHHLRKTGEIPPDGQFDIYEPYPVCVMGAADLQAEMGQETVERRKGVLSANRQCERFATWQPGFSLKDHIEMVQLEALRREQREEAQKSRDEAERSRTFQKNMAEAQRDHNRRMLIMAIIAATVALAGVCVNALTTWLRKEPPAPVINVLPAPVVPIKAEPVSPAVPAVGGTDQYTEPVAKPAD